MGSSPSQDHAPPKAQLRYAIIGCGAGVAALHLEALSKLQNIEVVAMCDIDLERGQKRAITGDCPFFLDHEVLLRERRPDVAVICTPHPDHPRLAKDCLRAGAHVLVEKPLAVDVADADEMIATAERAGRLLGVSFQERFRPATEYARAFMQSGRLGPVIRVLSSEPWLRTAAYYRSASWRGTWKGEGGGVLLNQASHTLDLLCHLTGMPATVWGMTRTRVHAMECEDSAQAMLEYENGGFGYLTASTVEGGTEKRIEVVGDRALLKIADEQLSIVNFDPPLRDHIAAAPHRSHPRTRKHPIELAPAAAQGHLAVHEDFQAAILEGRAPRCDGREALMSLELANAIVLSSFTERPVKLPLDRRAYTQLLDRLRC